MSDKRKKKSRNDYRAALRRWTEHEQAVQKRLKSPDFIEAPKRLAEAIEDLEKRGLLQYDGQARHYDLHPVVRGIAAGGLALEEKETLGQRVVDHFSALPHNPYEYAETLEDVRDGLHVVRTFVQMGRFQEALEAYRGDLGRALLFNLEAYAEIVALLRSFFPDGWGTLPPRVDTSAAAYLANEAALPLRWLGQEAEELAACSAALVANLELKSWEAASVNVSNLSISWSNQNRLAKEDLCLRFALDMADLIGDLGRLFVSRLFRFRQYALLGRWPEAEALWQDLSPMGRKWNRAYYRPGSAEVSYARARFWQGALREEDLSRAEHLTREGRSRKEVRNLHGLRGEWRLERGEWALAAESLHEAVAMAQAVGDRAPRSETQLALAKLNLGQLTEPSKEAERLESSLRIFSLDLAALWLAIDDQEKARKHALAAYKWAWADGEPFVRRYELNKARALLERLGAEIPSLSPYDPASDEKLPWEDAMRAAIEELRTEKAAEAAEVKKPKLD